MSANGETRAATSDESPMVSMMDKSSTEKSSTEKLETEKPSTVTSTEHPTDLSPTADTMEKGLQSEGEENAPERPGERAGISVKRFWLVMVGLMLGMFLTALDFNIVATAVPTISSDFHDYRNSSWLGTAFLLPFALVLPVYARLGDLLGRQRLFMLATLIFILGSGLCGGSQSMNMLIWSRVVQGIGASGIYGLVNVIVTDLVPLREVGKYLSFVGMMWAIADVLGPILGGAFSEYVTWRWIFYINLCISPVSLLVTFVFLKLPQPKLGKKELASVLKNFDFLGSILLIGGFTCILLAISWGGNNFPWDNPRVIGCLVAGPIIVGLFIASQFFIKDPLIAPSLVQDRTSLTMMGAQFFFGCTMLGMMYYVPQYFQLVFKFSATLSGVGLLPMMLGICIGNPVAAFVTSKFGVSLINAQIGAALEILFLGLITRWNASTSTAVAIVELVFLGIGMGAVMSALLMTAQVAVEPRLVGIVTGVQIFAQGVGHMFGIAMFAAAYVNTLTEALHALGLSDGQVALVLSDVQDVHSHFSPAASRAIVVAYANSLQNGWWVMFACACALGVFCLASKQHKFK